MHLAFGRKRVSLMRSLLIACTGLALLVGCSSSGSLNKAAEQAVALAETAERGDAAWLDARRLAERAADGDVRTAEMAGIIGRSMVLGPDSSEVVAGAETYLIAGLEEDPSLHWLLGLGYENGWYGQEPNADLGCTHYVSAAEEKLSASYWKLGLCYLNGTGLEQNDVSAFEWMEKAANAGDQNGMVSLAVLYAKGQGTEKDPATAASWYTAAVRAAGPNYPHALRGLGAMHLLGELENGIQQRGYALLEIAHAEGDAVAGRILGQVQPLDEEQRVAVDVQREFLMNFYKIAERRAPVETDEQAGETAKGSAD